jgi:hypothetical protein
MVPQKRYMLFLQCPCVCVSDSPLLSHATTLGCLFLIVFE